VEFFEQKLDLHIKEKVILDNSYHVVTVDFQKEMVAAEVSCFFRRLAENGSVVESSDAQQRDHPDLMISQTTSVRLFDKLRALSFIEGRIVAQPPKQRTYGLGLGHP
jgi:hypothetical protein